MPTVGCSIYGFPLVSPPCQLAPSLPTYEAKSAHYPRTVVRTRTLWCPSTTLKGEAHASPALVVRRCHRGIDPGIEGTDGTYSNCHATRQCPRFLCERNYSE